MSIKQLKRSPFIPSVYARAIIPKKIDKTATALPDIGLQITAVKAKSSHVRKYEKLCGWKESDHLPSVYVHMLVFPLMMELMLDKSFPYPLMGLVHITNTITQHRPIAIDESMDITCRFGDLKPHNKGKLIELISEVRINNEVVWEETADMLVRLKVKGAPEKTLSLEPLENKQAEWKMGSTLGARYALISGDSNPIHLTTPSAKLLGFKKHIAHGMWSKARCLADIQDQLPDAYTATVEFKLPIFLPTTVSFYKEQQENKTEFEIRSADGKKPHMRGSVIAL